MKQIDMLAALNEVGAYRDKGHFVYTSGTHGSVYINKDAIYPHTKLISELCQQIAHHYASRDIAAVIGPAVGGVVLSQWVAHHLSRIFGREVLSAYADKRADGSFIVRRGYDKLIKNKTVLLVDDIINQGTSVRAMAEAIAERGGQVVSVACLVNRGGRTAEGLDVKEIFALLDLDIAIYTAEKCPLCAKKIPINTDFGHGRKK